MKRSAIIFAAAVALGSAVSTTVLAQQVNTLTDAEKKQGWNLLFNGQDFTGWRQCNGTATPANDSAEGQAVSALFGDTVPGNSTKGYMGHTLGAAGVIEAIICAMALTDGRLPGSRSTGSLDPAIPIRYQLHGTDAPLRHALSNSFGFGGSNCSLVLGVAA